jgi:hypothetical protein
MATGITQEDVWQAADALLLEGARPTIERVRQKIGRGSPNTVSPYLDTWFRGLGARIGNAKGLAAAGSPADRSGHPGEAGLPQPVVEAAESLWLAARKAARVELEEEAGRLRAEADRQQELLAQERQAVQEQAQRLQARESDLQEAIALLKSQLHAAEARAHALAQEQQRTLERLADTASQVHESRQAHDRLVEQMQSERAAHATERVRADERARAQETRWLNELDAAREAARRLQQQLERAAKAADARQEKLNEALAQSRLATSQAESARVQLQETLGQTRHELAEARAQLGQMSVALRDRAEHIDALRDQLEQNRQANERAFALHAAREAEWSQQAAQWRAELQQAQEAASRERADLAERDRDMKNARSLDQPARKGRGTLEPES